MRWMMAGAAVLLVNSTSIAPQSWHGRWQRGGEGAGDYYDFGAQGYIASGDRCRFIEVTIDTQAFVSGLARCDKADDTANAAFTLRMSEDGRHLTLAHKNRLMAFMR